MGQTNTRITLALVDDHKLFRKGMLSLIDHIGDPYTVILEADNGKEFTQKLQKDNLPDVILMDMNMPEMDGFETTQWLNDHFPEIKVLVVSMIEKEEAIVKMLKLGVKGYLSKDVEPDELKRALDSIMNKGYYYTDFITGKLIHSLSQGERAGEPGHCPELSEREKEFLQLACSELTYKDIADRMCLSVKTIDGYRNDLFEKWNVKSRVGLVMFAVKHELVKV